MTKQQQLTKTPKQPRARKCLACREWFKPTEQGATTCSTTCAIMYGKTNITKQKTREKRKVKAKLKENDISYQKQRTRYWTHKAVRTRDEGKQCISCDTILKGTFHAGHFKSDGNHSMVRYDYDNIHGQCIKCNTYLSGNVGEYEKRLRVRIGHERVDSVIEKSKTTKKWTIEELIALQDNAKQLLSEMS